MTSVFLKNNSFSFLFDYNRSVAKGRKNKAIHNVQLYFYQKYRRDVFPIQEVLIFLLTNCSPQTHFLFINLREKTNNLLTDMQEGKSLSSFTRLVNCAKKGRESGRKNK